jgi:hypothetical protein
MSPCTAGQARLALRLPHILHKIGSGISYLSIIGSEQMRRVDLYIKVVVELDEEEKPERVASEICRQLEKMYIVRSAELSNSVIQE